MLNLFRSRRKAEEKLAADRNTEIGSRLARIERLVSRIYRDVERIKLHTAVVLEPTRALALLASGQRIYVDPRDRGGAINLLSDGKYEEDEIAVFRRYLRPGSVVLDIGANYGVYSISAAPYIRPGGRVIGFEPNPHICDLFRGSIYVNGLTEVVEARRLGVHNTNGSLRFLIDETGPGGARIVGKDFPAPDGTNVLDVPVVRLDDHLPGDFVADAIKIDVEGHEESVLRGMTGLIARSPNVVILMELFYSFFPDDETFVRFIAYINHDLGLTISRIEAHAVLTPGTVESLRRTTGSVLLSKQAPTARPDLTIFPEQLYLGAGATLADGAVRWAIKQFSGPEVIAHGPYVYLPKGYYRLHIEGDFEGAFTCALLESSGDIIAQYDVPRGTDFTAQVPVIFDAPSFEIAFWSKEDSTRMLLRKAELWKIG